MDCEYAPHPAYGPCRGPVAPRDAIHVEGKPPVPCARLCTKHAANLLSGYHGDLDLRELRCELRGLGACGGATSWRGRVRVDGEDFPACPLCDRHAEQFA